jgi:hypothetical protein
MKPFGVLSNSLENFARMLTSDKPDIPREAPGDPFCEQSLPTAKVLVNAHVVRRCSTTRLRQAGAKLFDSKQRCNPGLACSQLSNWLIMSVCISQVLCNLPVKSFGIAPMWILLSILFGGTNVNEHIRISARLGHLTK